MRLHHKNILYPSVFAVYKFIPFKCERAVRFALAKSLPSDNGGGAPPVPIPNTVVKSSSADGTSWSPAGRVGHRRALIKKKPLIERSEAFLR